MVRLAFLLGLGFLVILGMQDIQEQQETIKKSLVPPIKPIAKNIKFCHQCLYLPKKKMLVLGLQGCLYCRYKVFVLALQDACSGTTRGLYWDYKMRVVQLKTTLRRYMTGYTKPEKPLKTISFFTIGRL